MSEQELSASQVVAYRCTNDGEEESRHPAQPHDGRAATNVLECTRKHSPKLMSAREKEVLYWLALGGNARDVAESMKISVFTVRAHVRNILRKLSAVNIPHAVACAFLHEILRPDDCRLAASKPLKTGFARTEAAD